MRVRFSTFLVLAAACGGDKPADDTGSNGGDDTAAATCDPVEPACVDQIILDLSLHDDKVADNRDVTTTTDGDDFVTEIDATAGGYNNAANNPWVYVKFTASGAERVDIDDETALESMDWDLAFRRYIIRLNSGDSGPSCVAAATLAGMDYAEVDAVPDDVQWATEDFYDDECNLQEDSSGLPSSPDVVIGYGDWWSYGSQCVETTLEPHELRLADGSVFKMVVEAYYASGQDTCNETGSGGSGSGNITLRWRMLQ